MKTVMIPKRAFVFHVLASLFVIVSTDTGITSTPSVETENVASMTITDTVLPEEDIVTIPSVTLGSNTNPVETSISSIEEITTTSANDNGVSIAGDRESRNGDSTPQENSATTSSANATTETSDAVMDVTTIVPKQTYKEAEKEITDYVNSILRSILPQIVGGSGGAKLSPRCMAGMMKIFGYIRRMKGWTLKILDSMGKPSSGILKGTAYSMGSYDECLDLSVSGKGAETTQTKDELFRGKYCRIRIRFPDPVIETALKYHKGLVNDTDLGKLKDIIQVIPYIPVNSDYMNHFLGICFPSSCTEDDLDQLVELIPFPGSATVDRCEVKTSTEVDGTQLIIICVFLVFLLLAIASTCIDWILHLKKKPKSSEAHNDKRCVSVTVAFSFCNNSKKLMKSIAGEESLLQDQSVRGIVVASVAWIVLGHTYLFPNEGYYLQMSGLDNLRKYWDAGYFSIIMNSPLAIDALIVSYGFILTFSLWQPTLKDRDININFISLIIKHYIGLCLPLLLFFGVLLLLPLIGSGPFWGDLLEKSQDRCRENAAAHFGMYSNFLNVEDQCFPHLWFVSCLAQLTLVGIFLSGIFARSVKTGVILTLLLCIGCNVAVGIVSYNNAYPPAYVAYFTEKYTNGFWKLNLALPLSHFGAYAAGMVAGILVARKDSHRPRKILAVIGWVLCLGILYSLHLILFNLRDGPVDSYWSALYAGLHRTAFGICIAWILVACSCGMGGFVNSIFSWRIFDPLFRLSYYAYVFHVAVIAFVVAVAREHSSYAHLELVLKASSYIAVTYVVSYFLYMILEMPLRSLKEALCPKRTCQLEVTTLNNFPMTTGDFISKNGSSVDGSCKVWSINESHNKVPY